jgi:predicted metal-dependent hydrolase
MGELWKPNCIVESIGNKALFLAVPESVKEYAREKQREGWRFFVVTQTRGRCYYDYKVITIPLWVLESPAKGKLVWYISHELAHTYTQGDKHGQRFMTQLKAICPEEFQHWEIEYKPRNAIAAGINFNKDFL